MPGRASARTDSSIGSGGLVLVLRPGETAITVLDGRTPGFTPEQVEEAERKLAEASGPVVARVRGRTEESWGKVREELNAVAGGEASARVMVLAHHALRAHQALELQALAAGKAFGIGDELAEKHMRNQAGLAVVASDALNAAYEAAREEGKTNKGSPTEQLMARLQVHPAPVAEARTSTPVEGGAPSFSGSLPSQSTPSAKDPE
jgi:hypothetical protein